MKRTTLLVNLQDMTSFNYYIFSHEDATIDDIVEFLGKRIGMVYDSNDVIWPLGYILNYQVTVWNEEI